MTTTELLQVIDEAGGIERVMCVTLGGFASIAGCRVENRKFIMIGSLVQSDAFAQRAPGFAGNLRRFPNMDIEFCGPDCRMRIAKATPMDDTLVLSLRASVPHASRTAALVA